MAMPCRPNSSLARSSRARSKATCRDFALKAGKHCFKSYKLCGAYDELLKLLQKSIEPPRFEFTLTGTVGGAPFLGKPDVRFVLDLGEGRISVIDDFKVHGFCCKYGATPIEGLPALPGRLQDRQAQPLAHEGTRQLLGDEFPGPGNQFRLHGRLQQRICRSAFPLWLAARRDRGRRERGAHDRRTGRQVHGSGNPPLLRVANHAAG